MAGFWVYRWWSVRGNSVDVSGSMHCGTTLATNLHGVPDRGIDWIDKIGSLIFCNTATAMRYSIIYMLSPNLKQPWPRKCRRSQGGFTTIWMTYRSPNLPSGVHSSYSWQRQGRDRMYSWEQYIVCEIIPRRGMCPDSATSSWSSDRGAAGRHSECCVQEPRAACYGHMFELGLHRNSTNSRASSTASMNIAVPRERVGVATAPTYIPCSGHGRYFAPIWYVWKR
jgi:hypothetical protein